MADPKYGRLFTEDDVLRILRYGADSDWSEIMEEFWSEIMEEFDGPRGRGLTFPADEPLFLLRGQDKVAPVTIVYYRNRCALDGVPEAHLESVGRAWLAIKGWQAAHPDRVKVPDTVSREEEGS